MKKNLLYITLSALLSGIYSCDYISNPVEPAKSNDGESCISTPFPTTKPFRKVLVEDYTGHKCPNCPKAAISAGQLENTFHDSVIVIAVHAGYFAEATAATGLYPEDFRTMDGDAYNTTFGFSGYPNGLVNRKDFPSGNAIKSHTSWASEVNTLLRTPVEADLKMLTEYDAKDSTVCVNIQTKFLAANSATQKYNLCLMLIQDSIVAPQIDGTTTIKNYLHRHVLRDNINGTWGDEILNGSAAPTDAIVKKYRYKIKSQYAVNTLKAKGSQLPCKPQNCYLVAFVYEVGTYRILQAEEVKVIK
jgi:hypothetical protein